MPDPFSLSAYGYTMAAMLFLVVGGLLAKLVDSRQQLVEQRADRRGPPKSEFPRWGEHERAAVSGFAYAMATYLYSSMLVLALTFVVALYTGNYVDTTNALYLCVGLSLLVAVHVTSEYPNHFEFHLGNGS